MENLCLSEEEEEITPTLYQEELEYTLENGSLSEKDTDEDEEENPYKSLPEASQMEKRLEAFREMRELEIAKLQSIETERLEKEVVEEDDARLTIDVVEKIVPYLSLEDLTNFLIVRRQTEKLKNYLVSKLKVLPLRAMNSIKRLPWVINLASDEEYHVEIDALSFPTKYTTKELADMRSQYYRVMTRLDENIKTITLLLYSYHALSFFVCNYRVADIHMHIKVLVPEGWHIERECWYASLISYSQCYFYLENGTMAINKPKTISVNLVECERFG